MKVTVSNKTLHTSERNKKEEIKSEKQILGLFFKKKSKQIMKKEKNKVKSK